MTNHVNIEVLTNRLVHLVTTFGVKCNSNAFNSEKQNLHYMYFTYILYSHTVILAFHNGTPNCAAIYFDRKTIFPIMAEKLKREANNVHMNTGLFITRIYDVALSEIIS